jgi:hypothetical protein
LPNLEIWPVSCPWCGEPLDTLIDASGGDCQYTEDCQVCCSPILITVRVDATGQIESVDAEREN